MSEREWRKSEAAERISLGEWTVAEGAQAVGLSERQMRRICRRVEVEGVAGVIHRNRGKPAKRQISAAVREEILELVRGRYAGFNDTHLMEKLIEVEQIQIGRETLRRLLRRAGIGPTRKRRPKRLFRRRERKAQEGLMLLWDGSQHPWLEGRGPKLCLMGAVDDATGKLLRGAHFVEAESSAGYLRVLHGLVKEYGVPWSMYMDRHSCLKRNDDNWTMEEELRGEQHLTQVGRALKELEIEPIFALSPQAKGRIERIWGTLQDRLVSELRLAGAKTLEEANAVLDAYRPLYNKRFGRAAKESNAAWRPRPEPAELRRICAFSFDKPVRNNNTVLYLGTVIDLPAAPQHTSYAGRQVNLRHQLNDKVRIYSNDRVLVEVSLPTPLSAPKITRSTQHAAGRRPATKKNLTFKQIRAKHAAARP